MSRRLSLIILLGTVLAIGVLFFQVIQPFVFSILVAAVLAVLFRPLYAGIFRLLRGRRRIAAAATTILIVFAILLPLGSALTLAGFQLTKLGQRAAEIVDAEDASLTEQIREEIHAVPAAQWLIDRYEALSPDQRKELGSMASQSLNGLIKEIYGKTRAFVADAFAFIVGSLIMVLALYYFLADGSTLMQEAKDLSPLEDKDEDVLIDQFDRVCRGIVVGTVASAVAQAALAGIGFAFAGVPNVWLMMAVTAFFSFIPFLGAGSVCFCVIVWLALQENYVAAGGLLVYSVILVGTADNLIKAYVIGGEAQLHPLIALITVLGALKLIGLWGIFVGPMVAAFFYTFLRILRDRLQKPGEETTGEEPA